MGGCVRVGPGMSGLVRAVTAALTPQHMSIAPCRSVLSQGESHRSMWNAIPGSYADGGDGGAVQVMYHGGRDKGCPGVRACPGYFTLFSFH